LSAEFKTIARAECRFRKRSQRVIAIATAGKPKSASTKTTSHEREPVLLGNVGDARAQERKNYFGDSFLRVTSALAGSPEPEGL
jgi:hypothetical protein